jgi:hypothetical protein
MTLVDVGAHVAELRRRMNYARYLVDTLLADVHDDAQIRHYLKRIREALGGEDR